MSKQAHKRNVVCNLDDETLEVANFVLKRFGKYFPAQKYSGLVILERCGIVEPSLTGVD